MNGGWVYIMTSDLARRTWEHRERLVDGFTKRYGLKRLVYAERHDDIQLAIQREKLLKHWSRPWKVQLISERIRNGRISMIGCCSPWMPGSSPGMTTFSE
jgi:putative endonuclease